MAKYNFTSKQVWLIIKLLKHPDHVLKHWQQYGDHWQMGESKNVKHVNRKPYCIFEAILSSSVYGIMNLVKLGILVPEIENDIEYRTQVALGLVEARIYYMSDDARKMLSKLYEDEI